MSEPEEAAGAVVPIRPDAEIAHDRARQLLEHFADRLASFPVDHKGEEAVDVAFVIVGAKGTARPEFLIGSRWRSTLSFAAALLQHAAMKPD